MNVEMEIQEFETLATVARHLRRAALEIAAGKRGLMGAGELGEQAAKLTKVIVGIANSTVDKLEKDLTNYARQL